MIAVILTILAVLMICFFWISLYETHHFVVSRYSFSSKKIRKDTRIVMLSDLHNCQYGSNNRILLQTIENENPDLIVFAGDMITAERKDHYTKAIELMNELYKKYPVYYGFGNHEEKLIRKTREYGSTGDDFQKALQKTGIKPLLNEHVSLLERGICITGLLLEHSYFQHFHTFPMEAGYLDKKLGKKREDQYVILLAHNPEYMNEYAEWKADLVFSGHIHGGMIRLPFVGGVVSPAIRFFPKYDGGIFKEKDTTMILSRGIGSHDPNIRFLNPAEVIVVDLKAE